MHTFLCPKTKVSALPAKYGGPTPTPNAIVHTYRPFMPLPALCARTIFILTCIKFLSPSKVGICSP